MLGFAGVEAGDLLAVGGELVQEAGDGVVPVMVSSRGRRCRRGGSTRRARGRGCPAAGQSASVGELAIGAWPRRRARR